MAVMSGNDLMSRYDLNSISGAVSRGTSVLNMINDFATIMDLHSRFVGMNNNQLSAVGYKKEEDIIGLSYHDFRCSANEQAGIFAQQDADVIKTKQPAKFLSYQCLAKNTWSLLLVNKRPIVDNTDVVTGVYTQTTDITDYNLIDIGRFLVDKTGRSKGKLRRKSFTFQIVGFGDKYGLSKGELEVVFYLLRGKTAKEISSLLCKAQRTIECRLESLKDKFGVCKRSHLIEKAISEGFMNIIPENLISA